MLGFAPNIVFFRVNGSSAAEKSWLACATVSGGAALPSNLSRTARAVQLRSPGDFVSVVVDAVLLCFALQSVQIAVGWLRQGFLKGTCSSVPCCNSDCVLQLTVP